MEREGKSNEEERAAKSILKGQLALAVNGSRDEESTRDEEAGEEIWAKTSCFRSCASSALETWKLVFLLLVALTNTTKEGDVAWSTNWHIIGRNSHLWTGR